MKNVFAFLTVVIASIFVARAQQPDTKNDKKNLKYSNKLTLGTDLAQPFLLGGLNLNVSYSTNSMIFDWSHGVGLEIPDFIKSDNQEALNAQIEIPWTTGPGIGYRWNSNWDTRIDLKAHRTEVDLLEGQQKLEYTAYTLGPGVYYRFYFGKKTGFGLEASARYWFELGNSQGGLNGSAFEFNDLAGNTQKFDTNINGGIGINVALIYTFNKLK